MANDTTTAPATQQAAAQDAAPQSTAPAAAPAKAAEPSRDYEAELAKLSKELDKAHKKLADAQKQASDPEVMKASIAKLLGIGQDKDPAAEVNGLRDALTKREQAARKALIRAEVTQALAAEQCRKNAQAVRLLDLDDIEVDLDSGTVAADAIRERVAKLKADVPEFFMQPAAVAPAAPAAQPTVVVQGKPIPQVPSAPAPTAPVKLSAADLWKLPFQEAKAYVTKTRAGN